jgi:hypothetical protein
MTGRSSLWYGLGAILIAGAVLLVRERVAQRVREVRREAALTAEGLRLAAETVPDGALYQRYQLRRQGVDSMRVALRAWVVAESAYTADSGHPTAFMPQAYAPRTITGNIGPYIRITPNGWYATINNLHTAITCAVFIGPDTSFGTAKSGEPVCVGEKD